MQVLRSRWGRVGYAVVVLVAFGMLLWGFRGTSAQLYNRVNGGEILFQVERRVALHPGDCIMASWRVEGIEKVFFDDDAAVGEQAVPYCPNRATYPAPMLYIDFQGNFIQRFTIPIVVLTAQWWFWAVVGMLLILGYLSFGPPLLRRGTVPFAQDGMSRRALVFGAVGAVVLVVAGGVGWTAAHSTRVVTLDEGWMLDETEVKP